MYYIEINGRKLEIEISANDAITEITVDGRTTSVDFRRRSNSNSVSLLIDNRSHLVDIRHDNDRYQVHSGSQVFDVLVMDERSASIRELIGEHASKRKDRGEIRAPMPGLVVKLNAGVGDQITCGQGVIVVEAMKMENEIPAPISGTIESIKVKPGMAVDKGDILLVIKADED